MPIQDCMAMPIDFCQCIHLTTQNLVLVAFSQPVVHCKVHDLGDAGAFLMGDLCQSLVLFGIDQCLP